MTDRDTGRGLGRVVYSVEPEGEESSTDGGSPASPGDQPAHSTDAGDEAVEEASEESFPASDPPAYAVDRADPTTDPD